MSDSHLTKTNPELLLDHLPEDSLAAKLVRAHIGRGVTSSADALRNVLHDRLKTIIDTHAERSDQ